MAHSMEEALEVFQAHWGHQAFRRDQQAAIECVLAGQDVICVLPTGGGKSAIFQVPALLDRDQVTLVVSPLIALMKDQVDDAERRKVPATFINSTLDDEEQEERMQGVISGAYRLLYLTPERIRSGAFIEAVQRTAVARIVVDEAHCASVWGHDFRPAYARIHELVRALTHEDRRPPVLAVTATATPLVIEDVCASLGLDPDQVTKIVGDPIRANITYRSERPGNPWRLFQETIRSFDPHRGRAVVYSCTKKGAEHLAEVVRESHGDIVDFYHAGMSGPRRTEVQERFKRGEARIICATTAFGMGIDVEDILLVYNHGVPGSLEDLVQMAGRAGRNQALQATHILSVDDWSISFQQGLIEDANPPWRCYPLVWDWLHSQLQPTEELRISQHDMSQQITAERRGSISPNQVGAVLRRMAAYGLIRSRPVDKGTPISFRVEGMRQLLASVDAGKDPGRPIAHAVWRALWKALEMELDLSAGPTQTVYVNKVAIAQDAGVQSYGVGRALDLARDKRPGTILEIGNTYTGNAIRILRWREQIDEILPADRIEAKLQSDLARFQHLLAYTLLPTSDARKQKIRDYFLKEGGAAPLRKTRPSLTQRGRE